MRTRYKHFTIGAGSGTVTDRATGIEVGFVRADSLGRWHGTAWLTDGSSYQCGPWDSAYAAADAVWLVATAGSRREEAP